MSAAGEFSVTVRREIVAPAETLFDAWLDIGLPDEESRAGHAEGWSDALAVLERRLA